MSPDPRWSAEAENGLTQMLAEEFVVSTTGSRDPNRLAARAVLDWMAHRGLLVEPGGETREAWRVGGYSARNGDFVAVLALPETEEEAIAEAACGWLSLGYDARAEVCTVTMWPDGQQHRSSWRLVESEPQP